MRRTGHQAAAAVRVGFFGKLPSRGDFVRSGLSAETVAAWDAWLQAVLPLAEQLAGQAWADIWHTAPCWRFRLAAGLCGPHPCTGLWLASTDRVGRRFPLLAAAETPLAGGTMLNRIEAACRAAMAEGHAPDALAARLQAALAPEADAAPSDNALDFNAGPAASLWWRAGQETILSAPHMPDARQFLRMLAP